MNRLFVLLAAASVTTAPAAASAGWVAAKGKSCASVCANGGVTSGRYQHPDARLNGQRFYVCRADPGDGLRPGYNLEPNWSSSCWVAHGGLEKPVNPYQCLCR